MHQVRRYWGEVLIISLWLALSLAVTALYVRSAVNAERSLQRERHDQLAEHIRYKVAAAETALEIFAAYQSGSAHDPLSDATRTFAANLLARYPQLYSLQLIQRVSYAGVPALQQRMAMEGYPGFRINDYYRQAPQLRPAPKREIYYPIIFVEPRTTSTAEIVGLNFDLDHAMGHTLHRPGSGIVTTPPFPMVEGGLGYAIVRPARHSADGQVHQLFAEAVVTQSSLMPEHPPTGSTLRLWHVDAPDLPLLQLSAPPIHGFWQWLLPELVYTSRIASEAQPLMLESRRQLGAGIFDPIQAAVGGTLLILLLLVTLLVLQLYHGRAHAHEQVAIQLARLASHDALTGIGNRRALNDAMQDALRRNTPCTLVYIDLDHFKPVNDTHGHEAGDLVLRTIAERLGQLIRSDDTLARWGGDEFVMLLDSQIDSAREQQLLGQLERMLNQPINWQGEAIQISASIGIAHYPRDGYSPEDVVKAADQRMYASKQSHHSTSS
ncbi:diguanylate cyclase domain-containing protein [Chitinibacteraceae bacterium HSL-7]